MSVGRRMKVSFASQASAKLWRPWCLPLLWLCTSFVLKNTLGTSVISAFSWPDLAAFSYCFSCPHRGRRLLNDLPGVDRQLNTAVQGHEPSLLPITKLVGIALSKQSIREPAACFSKTRREPRKAAKWHF